MIKYVLCLGVGAGIGYFVAMKKLEADYARLFEIRLEDAHSFYEERLERRAERARQDYEEPAVEEPEEVSVTPPKEPEKESPVVLTPVEKQEEKEKARVDYRSMYRKEEVKEPEPVEVVEVQTEEVSIPQQTSSESWSENHEVHDSQLTLLSDADYMINEKNLKQVPLNYFYGDDTLADAYDKIIRGDDRERVLGNKILQMVRNPNGPDHPEQIIYFENDEVENLFELHWNEGKFSDEVGLVDVTE